jgi:hypothetical protein
MNDIAKCNFGHARLFANCNPFGKAGVFESDMEGIEAQGCSGFSDYVQQLIRNDKKHRRKLEVPAGVTQASCLKKNDRGGRLGY